MMGGNQAEAADITQEAFLNAYKFLYRFQQGRKFSSWIYKITINICRDRFKKRHLSIVSLDNPLVTEDGELERQFEADSLTPDLWLEIKEKQRFIQEIVYALPNKYRSVIILRYFQNLSYEEISEFLDLPISTIKTRLFRAREKLKEKLEIVLKRGEVEL